MTSRDRTCLGEEQRVMLQYVLAPKGTAPLTGGLQTGGHYRSHCSKSLVTNKLNCALSRACVIAGA
jgi:hypothetical protein